MNRISVKGFCCALSLGATMVLSAGAMAHDTGKGSMDMSKMSGGSGDLHKTMMDGMQSAKSMKMTGNVDKDFASMMIDHHEQALKMAKVEMDQGSNPELKAMAQKMYDQQKQEIDDLKRFTK
jgi:uncharacterized protein (DUF305 family)